MDRKTVEESVLKRLRDTLERDDAYLDMELMGEEGLSSIEVMDLLSSLENEFRIRISSRELRKVETAKELADVIVEKLG